MSRSIRSRALSRRSCSSSVRSVAGPSVRRRRAVLAHPDMKRLRGDAERLGHLRSRADQRCGPVERLRALNASLYRFRCTRAMDASLACCAIQVSTKTDQPQSVVVFLVLVPNPLAWSCSRVRENQPPFVSVFSVPPFVKPLPPQPPTVTPVTLRSTTASASRRCRRASSLR